MSTIEIQTPETIPPLVVGDNFRFVPQSNSLWWTLRARDERWLLATCPAPFKPRGELWYCVVDLRRPYKYNGVGPGMVRSSLNALGGGWPYDEFSDEAFHQALADLNAERWELSNRRLVIVHRFEPKAAS